MQGLQDSNHLQACLHMADLEILKTDRGKKEKALSRICHPFPFQPQVTQICYSPICAVLQKPLQCCTRLTLAHNILPIQQRALLPIAIESGSPCNSRQLVGLFMSNRWAINLEAAKRRNKTGKTVLISQEEAAFTEGSIKLPSVPSQISY